MNIGESGIFFSVVEQYQSAYEKALQMMNVYEDAESEELKALYDSLKLEIDKFLNISGLEMSDCGVLGRHLHFIEYYLNLKNKSNVEGDIYDIVYHDLPSALRTLISRKRTDSHLDQKLKDSVLPLIQGKHYDSAIRKSFILLTERIRSVFGVTEEIDGDALVNHVFGKGGTIVVALDQSKKKSYRNLISGFYGVYRNKFAHNDVQPTLSEVNSIIEMANNIIIELEEIGKNSIPKSA